MTIKDELKFDKAQWKNISNEGQDFIKKVLVKDPDKRLTLKEILQHSWILKGESKTLSEMRKNSLPGDAFAVFSQVGTEKK